MPSKNDDGGWKKFMWNSETGELLGRTGGSWCEYDCLRTELGERARGVESVRLVPPDTCLI